MTRRKEFLTPEIKHHCFFAFVGICDFRIYCITGRDPSSFKTDRKGFAFPPRGDT